jgi:protein tyrosine/serine phosphatase
MGTDDLTLNPEKLEKYRQKRMLSQKIDGINYFNPSEQVPNKENIKTFTKIMDNSDNYPVLIHCYHGTGRAEMYSALYRIV